MRCNLALLIDFISFVEIIYIFNARIFSPFFLKVRIQRARTLSAFFYLFLKKLYIWILYFLSVYIMNYPVAICHTDNNNDNGYKQLE